jgi:hypothetical protein
MKERVMSGCGGCTEMQVHVDGKEVNVSFEKIGWFE